VVQDSKGGITTMAYDAGNNLTTVQFTGQGATLSYDYAYTADNQIKSITRNSDLAGSSKIGSTSFTYNAVGLMTNEQHLDGSLANISNTTLSYDAWNRLTQKTVNGTATTYSYDATSQLTQGGSATYSYDANGNRTMTGYSTTANEITTDGTWNYTYDNEGNRTKMVSIATGATWKFSYDNHNQLTAANYYSSDGGTLLAWVTYTTDALGHLIERDASSGQQTIRYAYDGDNAWADMDGSNNLATRRLFGPGADNPVAKISAAGVVVWYLLDYQNSVIGMVNSSGTSLGSVTYDGFGKTLTNTLGSYADAYMFQGARRDADTGMDYHDARWYDPNTGSWISRDPGGFAMGDANLYRFVGNGPTRATDPSGMAPQDDDGEWVDDLNGGWIWVPKPKPADDDWVVDLEGGLPEGNPRPGKFPPSTKPPFVMPPDPEGLPLTWQDVKDLVNAVTQFCMCCLPCCGPMPPGPVGPANPEMPKHKPISPDN
jgi:RHS repeat-associated protein